MANAQTKTKLVRRALGGLQIRSHGDVYQVIWAKRSPNMAPLFTSRSLDRAEKWRRLQYVRQWVED